MILEDSSLYMIFKVLTQISIKQRNHNKGFTLLELLVGLLIMSVVIGLSLNAFVQSSTDFNKDKKTIDSNQNLSAVLEMIGDDIKAAGEQIADGNFPAIEFKIAGSTETTLVAGSSKIIIRRAVSTPLTLCQTAAITTTTTSITVADNNGTIIAGTGANCNIGNSSSPFFAARPSTYNITSAATTTPATFAGTAAAPILPVALRQARDYRCALGQPNLIPGNTTDYCDTTKTDQVARIAVSDQGGHMLMFNQTAETIITSTAATTTPAASAIYKYGITVNTTFNAGDPASTNNSNQPTTSPYAVGNPIYLIEERVYTLVKDPSNSNSGILNLSINGGSATPLLKGLASFNISGKLYTDTTGSKTINAKPAPATVTTPKTTIAASDLVCPTANDNYPNQPDSTTATTSNPQYICQFNYKAAATDIAMDWKTIAGIRVRLQAVYDGKGQNATATTTDKDKLMVTAEYFPRNVLSK
jgi:prepilin-type N-terminal cleavage/methylation domain-containing protein